MAQQDDLYDLIQSLTRSEKRYIKIQATQHSKGEKSNYIRLFEALDKLKQYDEVALRKKFAGEKLLKYLSSEKNYLLKFILKSLRAYQRESSVPLEVMEILMEASILQDRGLYGRSLKWLERAEQIAQRHELFWMLLEILDRKRLLVTSHELQSPQSEMEALVTQKDALLQRIDLRYRYQDLYEAAFLRTRQELLANDQALLHGLEAQLAALETQASPTALSYSSRIYAVNLKAMLSRLQGQKAEALTHFAHALTVWDDCPQLQTMHPNRYRIALSNFLGSCFENERYAHVPETLEKFRAVPAPRFNQQAEVFQNSYFFELLYLFNTGQLTAAQSLVPHILKGLQTFNEKVNQARVLAYYFNIAMVYFVAEDYGRSREFVQRILDESGSQHRVDLQRAARLFQLLLHLEKENFDLLEYQYRSVQRYLNKQNFSSERHKGFLKFIYQAQQHRRFPLPDDLYAQLQTAMTLPGHLPGAQEIALWAQAKAKGQPIATLAFPDATASQ